jgi:hypothetical protein
MSQHVQQLPATCGARYIDPLRPTFFDHSIPPALLFHRFCCHCDLLPQVLRNGRFVLSFKD